MSGSQSVAPSPLGWLMRPPRRRWWRQPPLCLVVAVLIGIVVLVLLAVVYFAAPMLVEGYRGFQMAKAAATAMARPAVTEQTPIVTPYPAAIPQPTSTPTLTATAVFIPSDRCKGDVNQVPYDIGPEEETLLEGSDWMARVLCIGAKDPGQSPSSYTISWSKSSPCAELKQPQRVTGIWGLYDPDSNDFVASLGMKLCRTKAWVDGQKLEPWDGVRSVKFKGSIVAYLMPASWTDTEVDKWEP